jgi:hypothetical protein
MDVTSVAGTDYLTGDLISPRFVHALVRFMLFILLITSFRVCSSVL